MISLNKVFSVLFWLFEQILSLTEGYSNVLVTWGFEDMKVHHYNAQDYIWLSVWLQLTTRWSLCRIAKGNGYLSLIFSVESEFEGYIWHLKYLIWCHLQYDSRLSSSVKGKLHWTMDHLAKEICPSVHIWVTLRVTLAVFAT